MNSFRRGVIDYLGDRAGLRGREEWVLSRGADGSRTLTAQCQMWDTGIDRSAIHTVTEAFAPVSTFISQRRWAQFLGEGWFTFSDHELTAQLRLDTGMAASETVGLAHRVPLFVPHVVSADSWIVPCYDFALGGRQLIGDAYTSSLLADGSTTPRPQEYAELGLELVGEEVITVRAGTFSTWHFLVSAQPGVEDHVWTTRDGEWTMVRLRSDRLGSTYELVEVADFGWSAPGTD